MSFLKKYFDFKIYPVTWLAIVVAVLVYPCTKFMPESFGFENGILENIQMFFLFVCCYLGFTAQNNKKFFRFVSLFIIILILREVNCGRTIFFPVPGEVDMYYGWKDIKYGWLAHPLYGLYIASVAIYFLWNQLYKTLWNFVKNVKFPLWNLLFLIIGTALSVYADKCIENPVFEEMAEMLLYVSLTGIIWLYSRNEKFN